MEGIFAIKSDFLNVIYIILIYIIVAKCLKIDTFSSAVYEKFGARSIGIVNENKKEEITELFKEITRRCDRFVAHCAQTNYPDNVRATRLQQRWSNVRIRETDNGESSIAYIVNKDYEMRVCVTDTTNREPEDINTAMFVVIHELGHMASESYGHNDEFWGNFKLLLKEAIKIGIYDYQDYARNSQYYCGIKIYSTPCKDAACGH